MNIWIVEDEDQAAANALAAVQRVLPDKGLSVFRDRTILWGADLDRVYPSGDGIPVSKLDHMPDIVILDLMGSDGEFLAARFYEKLRIEEVYDHDPAFIILWSPKTGMPQASHFVEHKPKVDRRLTATNTKTIPLLEEHIVRCEKAWCEARRK